MPLTRNGEGEEIVKTLYESIGRITKISDAGKRYELSEYNVKLDLVSLAISPKQKKHSNSCPLPQVTPTAKWTL